MNAPATLAVRRTLAWLSAGDWVLVRAASQKPQRQLANSLPGKAHTSMSSDVTLHAPTAHWDASGHALRDCA